jgi:hypothetical protein
MRRSLAANFHSELHLTGCTADTETESGPLISISIEDARIYGIEGACYIPRIARIDLLLDIDVDGDNALLTDRSRSALYSLSRVVYEEKAAEISGREKGTTFASARMNTNERTSERSR